MVTETYAGTDIQQHIASLSRQVTDRDKHITQLYATLRTKQALIASLREEYRRATGRWPEVR